MNPPIYVLPHPAKPWLFLQEKGVKEDFGPLSGAARMTTIDVARLGIAAMKEKKRMVFMRLDLAEKEEVKRQIANGHN